MNWLNPEEVREWFVGRKTGYHASIAWTEFGRAVAAQGKVHPWNCDCFECMAVAVARLIRDAEEGK